MNSNDRLLTIVLKYRKKLQRKIQDRKLEMEEDNNEHYIVYNALGFSSEEGYQIDYQQNVGRFLYKYASSLFRRISYNLPYSSISTS